MTRIERIDTITALRSIYREYREGEYDECILRRALRDGLVAQVQYDELMPIIQGGV